MIKLIDILLENKKYILENIRQAKQYIQSNKLSEDDLKTLINIDPTPTRKFVGWMAKIWISEKPNISNLKNTIEEYNTFLKRGKARTKDINQFNSFKDLSFEVDQINKSGEGKSLKDLESDYEILINNDDILAIGPNTHEASRKLGLSTFAFRDCEEGGKDSAWCTTYKAPDHFNEYYYNKGYEFVYVKIKSESLINKLKKAFPKKYKQYRVMALYFTNNGNVRAQDGLDNELSSSDTQLFLKITEIE